MKKHIMLRPLFLRSLFSAALLFPFPFSLFTFHLSPLSLPRGESERGFSLFTLSAQPVMMRDVFAAMPDSIAPLVSKNNRLDCIDFIENNMEARVRNALDEYVTLEALTSDYARFRTSPSSFLEMKLLPAASPDTTFLLCLVRTIQAGEPDTPRRLEDSNIQFFHADWFPLDSTTSALPRFSLPPVSAFVTPEPATSTSDSLHQALRSLDSFHPVRLALSPDSVTMTATLQPAYLDKYERQLITPLLRTLRFRWDGTRFTLP